MGRIWQQEHTVTRTGFKNFVYDHGFGRGISPIKIALTQRGQTLDGKQYFKGCSFTRITVCPDISMVVLNNSQHNRKANPCALVFRISMQTGKYIEYAFGILLVKANPVIPDFYGVVGKTAR